MGPHRRNQVTNTHAKISPLQDDIGKDDIPCTSYQWKIGATRLAIGTCWLADLDDPPFLLVIVRIVLVHFSKEDSFLESCGLGEIAQALRKHHHYPPCWDVLVLCCGALSNCRLR